MPFPDIKDAGILAGFTRWGWPWHGIIRGGAIDGSGKAHAQPSNNDAWLIDMGLPPISLTVDEQAFATANNMEWRNYALIPGGRVYDTYLGDRTFIHVDSDNVCWKVALSFGFTGNTLNISASIVRFGLFQQAGVALPTPVIKTVDVACTDISLANAAGTYSSRAAELHDVWTNGARALVGVMLSTGAGGYVDMLSMVEIALSGAGGADGSGLTLAGSELRGQPSLTTGSIFVVGEVEDAFIFWAGVQLVSNDKATACDGGTHYTIIYEPIIGTDTPSYNYTDQQLVDAGFYGTYARYSYYDSAGVAKALRLRVGYLNNRTVTPLGSWVLNHTTYTCACDDSGCTPADAPKITRQAQNDETFETGWWLLENDTVVERMTWLRTDQIVQEYTGTFLAWSRITVSSSSVTTVEGALSSWFPSGEFTVTNNGTILNAFRLNTASAYSSSATIDGTTTSIGIHRMNTKATAFLAIDGATSAYGPARTPLGNLAVGIAPSLSVNFAWQRKTGQHEFDTEPICWV